MVGLYLNFDSDEAARKKLLFSGEILLYSHSGAAENLVSHARQMIVEALAPYDPEHAQEHLAVDDFIQRVGKLKTTFTNAAVTKALIQDLLTASGCDPEVTYFDVPRLRVVPHSNYLSAGVSYAYKAHRDTWYASPSCQVNWWMPVFDLVSERAMSFFPQYWTEPVANSSAEFDYGEWCAVGRQQAANQKTQDTRKHPLPLAPVETTSELRICGRSGELFMFSAAHLHATAENISGKTRFSIDFRTINIRDVENRAGAVNVDSRARGSTLGDFIRMSDFTPLPTEIVGKYAAAS